MARKVVLRRADIEGSSSAIFKLEKMIKDQYNEIWKEHIDELEEMAEYIEADAKDIAPVYVGTEVDVHAYPHGYLGGAFATGKTRFYMDKRVIPGLLKDSIEVVVSRSRRYPGIIARASAKNEKGHYDYALIQEENTEFEHTIGEAHYLSQPFYNNVASYLEEYGEYAEIPEGLEDYLEE